MADPEADRQPHHRSTVASQVRLALGMATFGSATPVSKIVTSGMPVFVGSGLRVAIGAIALAPFAVRHLHQVKRFGRRDWVLIVVIALFGMFGFSALMLYGMRMITGVTGAVVMSTEEEGVGLATGAWLGGAKTVLLMQSSGVGNIVNALGMVRECRIPLLLLVTMRGEYGEFNPWQVPMGQATPAVLRAMGASVQAADTAAEVAAHVDAAARIAFGGYAAAAVLISQRVIGIKSFQEQAAQ